MAGKGMGAATKGGGCVEKGPKNKMIKKTSQTSGPIMMAEGGRVSKYDMDKAEKLMENKRSRVSKYDMDMVEKMLPPKERDMVDKFASSTGRVSKYDTDKAEKLLGFKNGGKVKKYRKGGSCK